MAKAPANAQTDPLDALTLFEVAGPNVDVETAHVLAFFDRHAVELRRLRGDLVEGRFLEIDDARELGEEIYALCPDAVDQGHGFGPLVARLRDSGEFTLWWD